MRLWQIFAGGTFTFVQVGNGIQAQAIETLIRGVPLRPVADWVDIALILILAFVAPLPGLRLGILAAIGVAFVGNVLFLGGVQLAFDSGRIVTMTYPLVTAIVSTLGVGIPVIYALVAGDSATATLTSWRTWMTANSATIMIVLFVILGAKMAGSGISVLAS